MYTNEEKAINFVFKAFEGKRRNNEDINASFHSICVGYMLKDLGCETDIILTGFLHDVIEDTNFIVCNFGKTIADNVLKVSEDTTITDWKSRKIEYIERLKTYDKDIIIVVLADKLHNLVSDYSLYKLKGKEALETSIRTYDANKWYYLTMQEIFNEKLEQNELLTRYNNIIEEYFN